MADQLDWHVAVYASNEAERILPSLRSIAQAMGERRYRISFIVNGSRDGSAEAGLDAKRTGLPVEVHTIKYGDKANAINQFIHGLRQPARFVAQVDGYAVVGPDSFRSMEDAFGRERCIVAATGVSLVGRTMRRTTHAALAVGGRLNGALHAFRPDFLDRMAVRGIRLPVGLYRGDGLMGSMAAHDLDTSQPWSDERIRSLADATFTMPVMSVFRPSDLRRQYRREIRQARGAMENAAIKAIIYPGGYEALPEFADEMIAAFAGSGELPPVSGRARYFRRVALREVGSFRRPDPASLLPRRFD